MRKSWNSLSVTPCEVQNLRHGEACGKEPNKIQIKACMHRGSSESTRNRLDGTLAKGHGDRITGKRYNSQSHYNFVHKFIPVPEARDIPVLMTVSMDDLLYLRRRLNTSHYFICVGSDLTPATSSALPSAPLFIPTAW